MEQDWLFSTDEHICGLRTVAVLVKDDKILVQRDRNGKEYALPGGHIKIGETLEAGLIRETMEEMGGILNVIGYCGVKNVFGSGMKNRHIILRFIIWLNYVKIKKFLIMENLFLKKIIVMSLLGGCLLKNFKI